MSEATVLRTLRDEGLILPAHYQRERRKLAERRKAAFANEPTGPNQVWQLDFSEFETTTGGTWRLAGCRDYWSKYEHPFHVSPTANQFDAIDAIELALADYEALLRLEATDARHWFNKGFVLEQLQRRGAHMARVVRPDGVTVGLATLEDVIEELVGEIRDAAHHDEPNDAPAPTGPAAQSAPGPMA